MQPQELTPDQNAVASFIRRARTILNMNCRDFGEACVLTGTHRGRTVRRWERGELRPSPRILKIITDLLEAQKRQLQAANLKAKKALKEQERLNQNTNPQEGQV